MLACNANTIKIPRTSIEDRAPDDSTGTNELALLPAADRPNKRGRDGVLEDVAESSNALVALPAPPPPVLRYQTEIKEASEEILRRSSYHGGINAFNRRYRSHFGASPEVSARCWELLLEDGSVSASDTKEKFLWAQLLLKTYGVEDVNVTLASGVEDEKTFREGAWDFVEKIADLEPVVIDWENRKIDDEGNDCLTSVDGTDYLYQIPDSSFRSYKFKKGALRYLVILCIKTGHIVYVEGPFPAGYYNDIKCLRWSVLNFLDTNERMEADDGFIGESPMHCKCPGSFVSEAEKEEMQHRVLSRHEHVNKRLKNWGCLNRPFRHHDFYKHAIAFRACAVLTQLSLELGEPLWDVEYSDNY